ncbi:MAG: hypothetical protein MUP66_00595 [Candidatus Nanohaloarchaeota archaeon QJJ-5]|nr:hypothetical protein [Candidatus Nanohaloarchaeota archaeon QJJ-5]
MPTKQEVKQQYRQLINQDQHKTLDLNYIVAVSSGMNVVPDIPDELYKRAAWASNQGASFIEMYLGGPNQIYNEWDQLIQMSRQLGLSFDAHFPVKIPFDYANPYYEQREQMGFYYSHEFMYDFIDAWGDFKDAIESEPDVNGNQQSVYGINTHLVKSEIPAREERMAGSVSVDPFGTEMMESRIFKCPEFRVSFFREYLWESELKDNFQTLQGIANDIEGYTDFNILQRKIIVDHMSDDGYLTEDMLEAVSNLDETENMVENLKYLLDERPDIVEFDVPLGRVVIRNQDDMDIDALVNNVPGEHQEQLQDIQSRMDDLREQIAEADPQERQLLQNQLNQLMEDFQSALAAVDSEDIYEAYPDKESLLEHYVNNQRFQNTNDQLRTSAIQTMAGVRSDVPESLDDLKKHREGSNIAQALVRFDPELHTNSRWIHMIPKLFWEKDRDDTLRDQARLNEEMDTVYEKLKQDLKDEIQERLKETEVYDGNRDYFMKDDDPMSEGEVAFRDIINFRGGAFQDEMNRESNIFWEIMPRWMPFSDNEHLERLWHAITGIDPDEYSMNNLDAFEERLAELADSEDYDKIHAAGAAAYVWGQFTQVIGRGQDKTLVELLNEHGLTLDWESHNVGSEGRSKLWKPRDIIKVCREVNNTEINGETYDVMFCTIDMEHLAMNGVDPLWTIQGNEEHNFEGLEDGDGRYITKQHVTHPALSETGHHHQPIRRGDTIVFEHLYSLVERGFCERDDRPSIVMYEIGEEKAESTYMLRLMMHMIEHGVTPEDLTTEYVDEAWNRYDEKGNEDLTLKDYLVLKFFGLTDEEWHHEWETIFENAFAPLEGLLYMENPDHTWTGRAALKQDNQPEQWEQEKYR